MGLRFTGLWRHYDFLKLWGGQAVSDCGSQMTLLALPLTAILYLDASPGEMGLLRAAQTTPFLLFGLTAGVWVDRVRRRPLLIRANLGRATLLATIPLAALAGVLRIEQLYVVGFLVGVLGLLFTTGFKSFLATLVPRERLLDGYGKLITTNQIAQVTGPGLAGALVQLLTAPAVIVLDALSYVASAVSLLVIRTQETQPPRDLRRGLWREIGEGLRFVWATSLIRAMTASQVVFQFFVGAQATVYLLYATRELGVTATLIGVVFAGGGLAGVLAAVLIARVVRRIGRGWALIGAFLLSAAGSFVIAFAGALSYYAFPLLMTGQILLTVGSVSATVNEASLIQVCTPERLQGRVIATGDMLIPGAMTIGALAGGVLGDALGLLPVLWVAAAGMLLAVPLLWFSPIRSLREEPTPLDTPAVP